MPPLANGIKLNLQESADRHQATEDTDEEAGTTSAGIDTEIDRIIKDYTVPALIALAALAALAVMNYALSKGGKPNGQK